MARVRKEKDQLDPMDAHLHTLVDLLLQTVARDPQRVALRYRKLDATREVTWSELAEDVRRCVSGLRQLGIAPGDRVAQLSENRYEWIIADLAILLSGAIHVPIHAPLAADQVRYQVVHSGSRLLFVSGVQQQVKVESIAASLSPELQLVSCEPSAETLARRPLLDFHHWLSQAPDDGTAKAIEQAQARTSASSPATILYTSGTTGDPKGVVLTHNNLVTNVQSTVASFEMTADDVRLCFLPLSHIFARAIDLYGWIATGHVLCLATSRDSVLADCQWAKPTFISGVPYFFDRVHRVCKEQELTHKPDGLRNLLGGHIRICGSGGAALPEHLHDFYLQHDLPILQGYGLTETSPVVSLSTPEAFRRGSSGRPLSGVEVQIAADGEILTRGPHVMLGYWKDDDATAEIIRDGWLRTGDLGRIDDDGYLFITGRKKELIVTAAGKNIAPVLLESLLTEDPLIDQALVVGDGRNYLTALIVPNWGTVRTELGEAGTDATEADLRTRDDVKGLFHRQIEYRLSRVSYHEQIRRFTLLERPFSLEQHEMTPKLSLRRPVIHEHFQREIEAMYRK